MNFVDSFMAKIKKKPDDAEINRLRAVASHAEKSADQKPQPDGGGLGLARVRSGPSKSFLRLKAFAKNKSTDQVVLEEAARKRANEEFTHTFNDGDPADSDREL